MKPTKTETLREKLINLRARQNAEGYDYDTDIECRIKVIIEELAILAKRSRAHKAYRELLYDINGHHGPA